MGYSYVMSDIHGMAALFEKMLGLIGFGPEDRLFILGDMIDRGPDPDRVLDLVMSAPNMIALKGNHEDAFVTWYEKYGVHGTGNYYYNTYEILCSDPAKKKRIPVYVRFLKKLPLYRRERIGARCYLMAHASTEEMLKVWKRKNRLLWDSGMVDRREGIPGYISVVGHVPTFLIRGDSSRPARIWKNEDGELIDVDCGAAFPEMNGRLSCLCLETGREYYVTARECDHR